MNLPLIFGIAFIAVLTGSAIGAWASDKEEYSGSIVVGMFFLTAVPFVLGYFAGLGQLG